jgi:hypothetical protein
VGDGNFRRIIVAEPSDAAEMAEVERLDSSARDLERLAD